MAHKAVSKMENEDGSRGPHWSIEETTALASQHGISLSNRFNRYDWYVALNMIYSDFYKVIVSISNSNTPPTSTSKVALINGSGDQMVSNEISQGNRYFIYYNKCNGIFQTVNHIVPPTATPSES